MADVQSNNQGGESIRSAYNITVDDISNAGNNNRGLRNVFNFTGQDRALYQDPMQNQDYFPTLNQPTRTGQSSTQTTGSRPIFTYSGGVVPLEILDAREQALAKAAEARRMEEEKFRNELFKLAEIDDANFNRNLQNEHASFLEESIQEFKDAYGDDYIEEMKRSPSFNKKNRSFQFIADKSNEIGTRMAEVENGLQDGTIERTPAIEEALRKFYEHQREGDVVGMLDNYEHLNTIMSFDKWVKDNAIAKLIGTITTETTGGLQDKGNYYERWSTVKKEPKVASVLNRAKEMYKGFLPEQEIEQRIRDMVDEEITTTATTRIKPKHQMEGGGESRGYLNKVGGRSYSNRTEVPWFEGSDFDEWIKGRKIETSEGVVLPKAVGTLVTGKRNGNPVKRDSKIDFVYKQGDKIFGVVRPEVKEGRVLGDREEIELDGETLSRLAADINLPEGVTMSQYIDDVNSSNNNTQNNNDDPLGLL